MEIRAKYDGAVRDMRSGDIKITIVTDHMPVGLEEMQGDLRISLKPWKEKRSLDANAMLWACIGQLAEALHKDRESVYSDLLKSYGQCEYILAKPKTIPALKAAFRVVEEISTGEIGGEPAVQVACYIGSSAYDTAQFSRLIDGVLWEMKDLGLEPPPSGDMKRALEKWEEQHAQHNA